MNGFTEKVPVDMATKQLDAWLDYKNIFPRQREKNKDSIDILLDAIVCGTLAIDDESKTMTHVLMTPVEDTNGNKVIDKLEYKPRVKTGEINAKLKGQGLDLGMISAYGAAISGKSIGEINKLDTQDNKILQAVAVFFM